MEQDTRNILFIERCETRDGKVGDLREPTARGISTNSGMSPPWEVVNETTFRIVARVSRERDLWLSRDRWKRG